MSEQTLAQAVGQNESTPKPSATNNNSPNNSPVDPTTIFDASKTFSGNVLDPDYSADGKKPYLDRFTSDAESC